MIGHIVSNNGGAPAGGGTTAGSMPTVQISDTPEYDPDNYDVVNGLAGEEIYKKVSPSMRIRSLRPVAAGRALS